METPRLLGKLVLSHLSAYKPPSATLIRSLVKRGADLSVHDEDGNTALHLAMLNHKKPVVTAVLAGKPDETVRNKAGKTPQEALMEKQAEARNLVIARAAVRAEGARAAKSRAAARMFVAKKGTPPRKIDYEVKYGEISEHFLRARKNPETMADLLERMRPQGIGYLMKILGNHDEVDDVIRDCELRIIAKIGSIKKADAAPSWYFRILRNRAFDRLRYQRNASELPLEDIEFTELPSPDIEDIHQKLQLERAISKLPPIYQSAIHASLGNSTHKEAADELKITESAYKSRYYKAIQMMQRLLNTSSKD